MPYARIRKHPFCPAAILPLLLIAPAQASAATAEAELSPVAQLFDAGGPIIVILAILALIALGVSLVKFVQFARLSVGRSGFVADIVSIIRQGKHADALADLEPRKSPVAKVMAAAVRGNANPDMNDTVVREETTRIAQAQLDGLERGLAVISLIATIAPLLGLLGTVLGMIEAFQQMETVGDSIEPAVLAGGIWEALLTTAAGLAVAIPAAVLFTWLQRSVDVEAQHMEDAATQVFTIPLYEAAPQNVVTGSPNSAKSADKVAASAAA
ncbi:MotA/TolQ/ExbB proton channel family protein [Alterisphingorhabdus coralli]|uniref:MotA/TolQ/ExbB proton channel family protein n=1 Tax=Alterisphingorhabdus coralli TaxID=3071408 RepID=A0AA97F3S6_9SPHN|nr:MotA/TolQ/ExbB proton channel family protein [Parasphingorhabdus sp. SCSIO 66989]WOE73764.1 MotA/TolQ/ExbB proton channel family protein [Parasphingorhabdus sp. SCSIO 66989]